MLRNEDVEKELGDILERETTIMGDFVRIDRLIEKKRNSRETVKIKKKNLYHLHLLLFLHLYPHLFLPTPVVVKLKEKPRRP